MKIRQYEIWLADLNPKFGTEAGKLRPVLIVQSDILNRVHPSSIICPITTNIKDGVSILRVNLVKGTGGLKSESSIMIDQVRAIDNKRLLKRVGKLPNSLESKIVESLRTILDL